MHELGTCLAGNGIILWGLDRSSAIESAPSNELGGAGNGKRATGTAASVMGCSKEKADAAAITAIHHQIEDLVLEILTLVV